MYLTYAYETSSVHTWKGCMGGREREIYVVRHLSLGEHEMKMKDVVTVVFLVPLSSHVPLRVFPAALSVILLLTDTFFHIV